MPSSAPAPTIRRTFSYPRSFRTVTTGAAFASVFQFATPVSTSETLTYKHRANQQRHQDPERQIALRRLALLRCGRDRIESDVGEEDDGRAGQDARRIRSA